MKGLFKKNEKLESSSKVAKAGVGYTIANVLVRGIGFLTLPIFSRLLEPEDFGIYNIFMAYDAMLFCIVGFAIHSSVRSANWEFPERIDEFISSVLILYVGNTVFLVIISVCFGPFLRDLLGLEPLVLAILVIHSLGTAVIALYNARVSLQYSYIKYMVVAATSSLGNVVLSLALIFTLFSGQRYMGRIIGATIALGVVGLCIIVATWRKSAPKVNKEFWRFALNYSLPIVPHGVSQVILSQFSRVMVGRMVSSAAAGVFSLAANLMLIMTVLSESLSTVWSTWFYETLEGESASSATESNRLDKAMIRSRKQVIQKRSGQLMMVFAVVTVGVMALAPELIWLLGGPEFLEGSICAFGLTLCGYCIFVYNLLVVGEYYMQKTGFIVMGTLISAVISVVLNLYCIKSFGYQSAAFATLAAYIVYTCFHWIISTRLIGFSIIPVVIAGCLAALLAICCVLCIYWLSNPMLRIGFCSIVSIALTGFLVRNLKGFAGVKSLIRK